MAEPSSIEEALAGIGTLERPALEAAWAGLFGRTPPRTLSRRLLEYAAAYHLQAQRYGGLSPALKRELLRAGPPRKRNPLAPGSRLVREWHGRTHSVEVTETGFLYGGQSYRSLSEVARAITGARWSGPRFFGL